MNTLLGVVILREIPSGWDMEALKANRRLPPEFCAYYHLMTKAKKEHYTTSMQRQIPRYIGVYQMRKTARLRRLLLLPER